MRKQFKEAIPDSWTWVRLSDLGTWRGGGTPSKARPEFWTNGTIPWVSPKDMKIDRIKDAEDHITEEAVASSATNLIDAGAVLVVTRSGILERTLPVAVTEVAIALNQDLKALSPHKGIAPGYLAAALHRFEKEILHSCSKSGTTVASIEFPSLLGFELPIAPTAEQKRIVAEIEKQSSDLEAGVAALKRVQANLKRYRASVLKAACEGRLVPTEAELARTEGRDYEPADKLLERILKERRTKWETQQLAKMNSPGKSIKGDAWKSGYEGPTPTDPSVLPPLPPGWTWATVHQVSAAEPNAITDGPFGSNLKTEHYTAAGPRVVRLQNIGDGIFVDEKAHIAPEHFDRLSKHRLFKDDVVIAALGEVLPRACMVPESLGPAIVKADCIRVKPDQRLCLPQYLMMALNSEPTRRRTAKIVHGVGRPRMNLGEIKAIAVPLPPLAEQIRISAEVERRFSLIGEVEKLARTNLLRATNLRHAILRQAFDGRLLPQDPTDEPASTLIERIRLQHSPPAPVQSAPEQLPLNLEKPKKSRIPRRRSSSS